LINFFETDRALFFFGIWCLGFVWNLGFGIWDFVGDEASGFSGKFSTPNPASALP
jgi:hypothetical protein